MIRPLFLTSAVLVAGVCLAAVQGNRFKYTDGNLTVLARSGRSVQNQSGAYTFTLRGDVEVASAKEGIRLTSDQVVCDTKPGKSNQAELDRAVATGRVHAVKTVANPAGRQVTDITGSRGDLKTAPTGSVLNLAGPVTLVNADPKQRKTMTATGSSAVATLEPGTKSSLSNGLRKATLSGPVRVTVVQVATAGRGASTLVATGNRMELTNSGKEPTIVLTGNVNVHGEGSSSLGQFSGLSRLRLRLNSSGEVTSFDTEAGS